MRVKNSPESWLVALVIIAFCVSAIWLSTSFEKMPPILKRGIQPADFPQMVCCAIILLTLYMLWRDPVKVTEPMGSKTIGSLLLMLLFVALAQIDLFLALGIFAALLAMYWGERRILSILLVGLAVPVGVFFLFDQVFKIRFPRGLLTNMWYG
ncbi:MAG: tripartite tricarboxylate transporter TctB family protein [Granulosicoccus sp.]|nr:tripartite tricarboxylate transporter TctB family protein [Granulosicoccus sp.]